MTSRLIIQGIFVVGVVFGGVVVRYQYPTEWLSSFSSQMIARAEDDDEDRSDDNERDGENASSTKQSSSSQKVSKPKETIVTTYQQVQRTVVVLDEKFKIDTDGDRLVDGLDPNPLVPEWEYFLDDDDDGVPNALDRYPNDDDFLTFDNAEDRNGDGVVDSFEEESR